MYLFVKIVRIEYCRTKVLTACAYSGIDNLAALSEVIKGKNMPLLPGFEHTCPPFPVKYHT